MSVDLKIQQICPHLVVEELLYLEADRQTVIPKRPVSAASIDVRMNGYPITAGTPGCEFRLVRASQNSTERYIRFNTKLRSTDDFFEVSYFTDKTNCRRCQGLETENDYRYNGQGIVMTVDEKYKLMQDVSKHVITRRSSNLFHPWIGSGVEQHIGTKNLGDVTKSLIYADISETLNRYKNVQRQQARVQDVTPGETLVALTGISITDDLYDPTLFYIDISFTNGDGDEEFLRETLYLNV